MTTTNLIALLQANERGGATGRPREISFYVNNEHYIHEPEITISGSGDGMFTTLELNLNTDSVFPSAHFEADNFTEEELLLLRSLYASALGFPKDDDIWKHNKSWVISDLLNKLGIEFLLYEDFV